MLQQTTALRKIAQLRKPIRAVRGSQGSAKTISILIILINHASSKPDREIIVASEELTKMRLTVIKDFVKLMKSCDLWNPNNFIAGTLYRFPNGSFIKFIGLDKEDVGKGLRSHVVYINEINKITKEAYRQLSSRSDVVYFDYNPDAEFFVDTDILPDPDCDFIQLTFQDNELLPEREREQILGYYTKGYNDDRTIKDPYWANIWQVYGLGNIGNLQGAIFNNWEVISEVPKEAELIAYGLDWGFTNDPTALVAVYKWNQDLIIDELIYETGLTNSMLVAKMDALGVDKFEDIIADSSDPKSIQDLKNLGYENTVGAKKGTDSVVFGINKMQEFKIWVVSNQYKKNTVNEFRNYIWASDKNGKATGQPIDKHNHIIDPTRYVVTDRIAGNDYMEIS